MRKLGAVAHEVHNIGEWEVPGEVVGLRHANNYRRGYQEQQDFFGGAYLILADDNYSLSCWTGGYSSGMVLTNYYAISCTASFTFWRVLADTYMADCLPRNT